MAQGTNNGRCMLYNFVIHSLLCTCLHSLGSISSVLLLATFFLLHGSHLVFWLVLVWYWILKILITCFTGVNRCWCRLQCASRREIILMRRTEFQKLFFSCHIATGILFLLCIKKALMWPAFSTIGTILISVLQCNRIHAQVRIPLMVRIRFLY